MRTIALCMLFALAASGAVAASQPTDVSGWKMASGKVPTKAELAAVVAACEMKAAAGRDKPLAACLGDLGLKRGE